MAHIKIYAKPLNLFRYRPLGEKTGREIDALTEKYIYCPAFSDMNDPMEGSYRLSSRFKSNPNSMKSQTRVKEALRRMGVASMSEVYDHEPMWAHYADQFRGMCIQYNLSSLLKGLADDVTITRMMYSELQPVLLDNASTVIDRARLSLSSKTVRWASEREWRVFTQDNGPAQYREQRAVTKIFLGSRISPADEACVRKVGRLLDVPVSKMVIDAYAIKFGTSHSKPNGSVT